MKKKHVLYGTFIILLLLQFCAYKVEHEYGLILITNWWTFIIKLVIVSIGFKVTKKENLNFFIYILIVTYLAIAIFEITIHTMRPTYIFHSPNKTNTLIVEDRSSLHSGHSFLYEKKYYIFKRQLPYEPLFGYKIFSREIYAMEWLNENQVSISYESQDNIEKDIIIDFK